jgi:hypothetical protein
MLAFLVGLAWMTGKRLLRGWQEDQMAFFGSYRDWGPFDRDQQPVRFWLSTLWAAFWWVASLVLIVGIFTGDAGVFSLNAKPTQEQAVASDSR